MMSLIAYLGIAAFVFACGLCCVLVHRNFIRVLMGIELIFNAAALNFVAFSHYTPSVLSELSVSGQVVSLFIIALAVSEAVVAIALVVAVSRVFQTVNIDAMDQLKG